jgi:hypothetical protein
MPGMTDGGGRDPVVSGRRLIFISIEAVANIRLTG